MNRNLFDRIFDTLPRAIRSEILHSSVSRGGCEKISEIRLRIYGRCSAVIDGERIYLVATVAKEDMIKTVNLLCEGSMYSVRDSIAAGYISAVGGVRVGVCGHARYDSGVLVGVSDISSLVFRIPTSRFSLADALFKHWQSCKSGMLIFSPPGVGKTTALRSLVELIGKQNGEQVAVVDERCEFVPEDYLLASVDILRGYLRSDGIEIALRTLSPSVIAVDEVGRLSEVNAMLESLSSGVRLLATAHAGSFEELRRRVSMKPFFENGIFDKHIGISIENGKRRIDAEEISG